MRKAQVIMGTGVTIDVPQAKDGAVFDKCFGRLKEIDRRFSTYKKSSEVSRYARGELKMWQRGRELRKVLKACRLAEAQTDGYFSAWASGEFDPSGYVKGWAIEQAGKVIKKSGYSTYCISIGGDISARGDKQWRIGIQDPNNRHKTMVTIALKDMSVATSGGYVRKDHIINPKTGKPADEILSITVVGSDIIAADVLATAAFAMGKFGLNFIGGQAKGYEALMVDKSGKISMTPGMQALLA